MSVRLDPELVTSGPYALVRHPIYSGILLAFLGTAIVDGAEWLLPFIAGLVYFTYSAVQEEKTLTSIFPDSYPAYKLQSKMLIPYLF